MRKYLELIIGFLLALAGFLVYAGPAYADNIILGCPSMTPTGINSDYSMYYISLAGGASTNNRIFASLYPATSTGYISSMVVPLAHAGTGLMQGAIYAATSNGSTTALLGVTNQVSDNTSLVTLDFASSISVSSSSYYVLAYNMTDTDAYGWYTTWYGCYSNGGQAPYPLARGNTNWTFGTFPSTLSWDDYFNNDIYYVINTFGSSTPPPPSAPSVSFAYPLDGTTTQAFTNFLISSTNLIATHTYYGILTENSYNLYSSISSSPTSSANIWHSYTSTGQGLGSTWMSGLSPFPFAYVTQTIPFFLSSSLFVDSYPWSATFQLYDITGSYYALGVDLPVASSTISFNQLPISGDSDGTFTVINSIPSSTASGGFYATSTSPIKVGLNTYSSSTPTGDDTLYGCVPPSSILDVGGGVYFAFCATLQLALNPNVIPFSTSYFQQSLNQIESVPPFSAFFSIASSTISGLNNFSSSSGSGLTISVIGYNNTPVELLNLNSSTFYGGFTSSQTVTTTEQSIATMNNLEHYITSWLWIAAAIKILYVFTIA